MRARRRQASLATSQPEEHRLTPETRVLLEVLRRMAMTLERIEGRLDGLGNRQARNLEGETISRSLEITLSGSGFSCDLDFNLPDHAMVDLDLDLWDAGLPVIPALARVAGHKIEGDKPVKAFAFEELHSDDLEQIVQLSLRTQRETIREVRAGDSN